LFLILTPISASRSVALGGHVQNGTRLHFNQTSSVAELGLCFLVQGIISASYSIYSTYQSYKDFEIEKEKVSQASGYVSLFHNTHAVLCGAVDGYVRSLLKGAQQFQSIAKNPECDQADKDFLVTYLAEVRGQPLGPKPEIQAAVDSICSKGFTKSDAMAIKLEETWWKGVEHGLGCKTEPVDDKFLTDVWSGSSANQSSSLLQRKLAVELISLGLFVVVMHTDAFSFFDTFTPEGSSAKIYEDFSIQSLESLKQLSCRLSHPMYLRSLRAEVLERATLALEFSHADLTMPQQDVDVCQDKYEECVHYMACHEKRRCLIQIVDLFDKQDDCGRELFHTTPTEQRQRDCFEIWARNEKRMESISSAYIGQLCLAKPSSQFYKFCGPNGNGIVHQSCLKWEDWEPKRVNAYQHTRPFAKYDENCENTPFDRLKQASELVQNLGEKKTECGWPGI